MMTDDPYDMRANAVYKLRDELALALTERDAARAENARLTKEAMSDYHEGWEEGCSAMKEENAKLREALSGLMADYYAARRMSGYSDLDVHGFAAYKKAHKAMGETD